MCGVFWILIGPRTIGCSGSWVGALWELFSSMLTPARPLTKVKTFPKSTAFYSRWLSRGTQCCQCGLQERKLNCFILCDILKGYTIYKNI